MIQILHQDETANMALRFAGVPEQPSQQSGNTANMARPVDESPEDIELLIPKSGAVSLHGNLSKQVAIPTESGPTRLPGVYASVTITRRVPDVPDDSNLGKELDERRATIIGALYLGSAAMRGEAFDLGVIQNNSFAQERITPIETVGAVVSAHRQLRDASHTVGDAAFQYGRKEGVGVTIVTPTEQDLYGIAYDASNQAVRVLTLESQHLEGFYSRRLPLLGFLAFDPGGGVTVIDRDLLFPRDTELRFDMIVGAASPEMVGPSTLTSDDVMSARQEFAQHLDPAPRMQATEQADHMPQVDPGRIQRPTMQRPAAAPQVSMPAQPATHQPNSVIQPPERGHVAQPDYVIRMPENFLDSPRTAQPLLGDMRFVEREVETNTVAIDEELSTRGVLKTVKGIGDNLVQRIRSEHE